MKIYDYSKYDQIVYSKKINDLNVVFVPNDKFKTVSVSLFVDYGSTDINFKYKNKEYNSPLGAAHFIEHKIFELSDGSDAFSKLSALGADANAYTTYDETGYMFSCSENLYECFDVFLEYILTNTLNDKTINTEKGIIIEELMMYKDKPQFVIQDALVKALYKNCFIKDPILGTVESINNTNAQSLSAIYNAFYNPQNMTLNISGNFNKDEMIKYLENVLSKYNFDNYNTEKIYPEESLEVNVAEEVVEIESDVNYVAVGIKMNPNYTNYVKDVYIQDAISFMMFHESIQKMNQLIETEVVYSGYSFSTLLNRNYSFIEFLATTDKQDLLIKELKNTILNFKNNFIEEDFLLYKKITFAQIINCFDNLETLAQEVSSLLKENCDYLEQCTILENLTKEDLINYMDNITEQNISIIKTIKKK